MARMDEEYVRKGATLAILVILLSLSFLLIKPIALSIIGGIILSFIFSPVYDFFLKKFKSKNFTAFFICLFLIIMIVLPLWFLTPIFINQSFKIFLAAQGLDLVTPLKQIFPSFFVSESFSNSIGEVIQTFLKNTSDSITTGLTKIVFNLPIILLHFIIVLFTFFYVLRDKDQILDYIKSLSPFSKDTEKKLLEYTSGITSSVIYGQVIVGIIQGAIAGLGFIIFGVPNALFLTLVASIVGVLPIIGPVIIWIPVVIFLIADGQQIPAIGVIFFGLIASSIDNILRPLIVSLRTRINTSIVLIGMIGGYFMFGIIGFVLGPLILGYLFIVLELYRKKETPGIFIQEEPTK